MVCGAGELAEFRRTGKGYRKEMEGGFPMFPGEAPPGHPYRTHSPGTAAERAEWLAVG